MNLEQTRNPAPTTREGPLTDDYWPAVTGPAPTTREGPLASWCTDEGGAPASTTPQGPSLSASAAAAAALFLAAAGPIPAVAEEMGAFAGGERAVKMDSFEAWGKLGPSPYYPEDGLQSPIRDNGLHLGGDIWIDSGYEESQRELEGEPDMAFWLMQGRFMLDATATYTYKRFFAQAKAQLLAHIEEIPGNEYIDTDDAWIRFGMWDLWDLQFGRFEAWEVYRKGEGLERDTLEDVGAFDGPDIYEVNYAFYRQDGFGQAAAHAYPLDWLRFEVASVLGNELGFNSLGVRTTGIVDLSWLKVKLAGEYRKLRNREEGKLQWEEKRGFGGGVQVNLDDFSKVVSVRFGVNSAWGLVDRVDAFGKVDERGSPDTFSAGGFVNLGLWSAVLGAGYNHTLEGDRQINDITGRVGHYEHRQAFLSARHPVVFPWLQAKLVLAWADADLEPSFDNPRTNEMYSVRLRLYMVF